MIEINNKYLYELSLLKESEDHIEFKEAKRNYNFDGGDRRDPKDRRHCILGYVAALANEQGGRLVFGMKDKRPHDVVGTSFEGILQKSKSGKIFMSKEHKKIASEIGVNRNNDDKVNDKVNDTYLIIKDNPGIQRKGIFDFSSKSLSTIDRHIAILVKSGLVEHRGSDKNRWLLCQVVRREIKVSRHPRPTRHSGGL